MATPKAVIELVAPFNAAFSAALDGSPTAIEAIDQAIRWLRQAGRWEDERNPSSGLAFTEVEEWIRRAAAELGQDAPLSHFISERQLGWCIAGTVARAAWPDTPLELLPAFYLRQFSPTGRSTIGWKDGEFFWAPRDATEAEKKRLAPYITWLQERVYGPRPKPLGRPPLKKGGKAHWRLLVAEGEAYKRKHPQVPYDRIAEFHLNIRPSTYRRYRRLSKKANF